MIRPACFEDARTMAKLIDIAGEGIPNLLWSKLAEPGQSALDVGQARACCDVGGFSYRNALVADGDESVVGMVLGYIVGQPDEAETKDLEKSPDFARPFATLEHHSAGTFYIDALAVLPGWRGCGVGSRLLKAAEQRARTLGVRSMSIQHFAQTRMQRNCTAVLAISFRPRTPVRQALASLTISVMWDCCLSLSKQNLGIYRKLVVWNFGFSRYRSLLITAESWSTNSKRVYRT